MPAPSYSLSTTDAVPLYIQSLCHVSYSERHAARSYWYTAGRGIIRLTQELGGAGSTLYAPGEIELRYALSSSHHLKPFATQMKVSHRPIEMYIKLTQPYQCACSLCIHTDRCSIHGHFWLFDGQDVVYQSG
jgi:hypothetical protein